MKCFQQLVVISLISLACLVSVIGSKRRNSREPTFLLTPIADYIKSFSAVVDVDGEKKKAILYLSEDKGIYWYFHFKEDLDSTEKIRRAFHYSQSSEGIYHLDLSRVKSKMTVKELEDEMKLMVSFSTPDILDPNKKYDVKITIKYRDGIRAYFGKTSKENLENYINVHIKAREEVKTKAENAIGKVKDSLYKIFSYIKNIREDTQKTKASSQIAHKNTEFLGSHGASKHATQKVDDQGEEIHVNEVIKRNINKAVELVYSLTPTEKGGVVRLRDEIWDDFVHLTNALHHDDVKKVLKKHFAVLVPGEWAYAYVNDYRTVHSVFLGPDALENKMKAVMEDIRHYCQIYVEPEILDFKPPVSKFK